MDILKNLLLPGIGLGMVAGAMLGMKFKSEEKQVKRSMHKAKKNMEDLFDTMGM